MSGRLTGFLAVAMLAFGHAPLAAQDGPPRTFPASAPAEPGAIPLYGADNPGSPASERWHRLGDAQGPLGVANVSYPTLTPVLPDPSKANGAAVIVAPGGAFLGLAMSHEGWDVARALANEGIAAFVLKYRVIPTPADPVEYDAFVQNIMAQTTLAESPHTNALMQRTVAPIDGIAALAVVRSRATEWSVDPRRVGMIGFSAGAMTALHAALRAEPGKGPDFFGYVYGPMHAVAVPAKAPPMFAALAMDDPLFPTMGVPIAEAWHKAGRPVELHAYQTGGHGFGLGKPGMTTNGLFGQFVAWMRANGFLQAKAPR